MEDINANCLQELNKIVKASLSDLLCWDGDKIDLKSPKDIPMEAWAAVESIQRTVSANGEPTVKLKLYDKAEAIKLILQTQSKSRENKNPTIYELEKLAQNYETRQSSRENDSNRKTEKSE